MTKNEEKIGLETQELNDGELNKVTGGENISFLNDFYVGLYFTNNIEHLVSREYMYPINGDKIISFDAYSSSDLTLENYNGIKQMTWNQLFQNGFEYFTEKSNPNYKPR